MVENEGLDDDTSLDEVLLSNLPPPGAVENNTRSGTITESSANGLSPVHTGQIPNNITGSNFKTKKTNQTKVPNMYIGSEERQKLLDEQAATNKFHKFVEGNLILKQGKILKLLMNPT